MNLRLTTLCGAASLLLTLCGIASAQEQSTANATLLYQAPAHIEGGGKVTIARSRIQSNGRLFATRKLFANWSLGLGLSDYNFDNQASNPWDDIYQGNLTLSLLRPLNQQWSLLLSPSINVAGEADAQADRTISYGLLSALNWQVHKGLRLGLGFAAFENLEESQLFPVIIVDWQLSPNLRLANPLRAGVTGPAGLELSWQAAKQWTLAAGGAARSYRFRLAKENRVSEGIGEESIVPVWLRLSRQLGAGQLTLYTGAVLNGSLKLEENRGRTVSRRDYDETPFLALYFSGPF